MHYAGSDSTTQREDDDDENGVGKKSESIVIGNSLEQSQVREIDGNLHVRRGTSITVLNPYTDEP